MSSELIPHLFRNEFPKIVSVLSRLFGLAHVETAEDIVSDTFLLAAETWGKKGLPENPTAWLYTVAKNKAKDHLKRNQLFTQKIAPVVFRQSPLAEEMDIDLSEKNIADSQLQMMFAVCHPCIPAEAQVGLCLRILCGFGITEIAAAFLSNPETINKRLFRAKEKLRDEKIQMELPGHTQINNRLQNVLTTLYLLFNEGYFSQSGNAPLKKELCTEAMRLTLILSQNQITNQPPVNALLALMCFHSSRFEARHTSAGEVILYEEQDQTLWNTSLVQLGEYYLAKSSVGTTASKYHLEAAIAFWHTKQTDTVEKWENILQLYNRLLQIEYSPVAALNRTYALAKAGNPVKAIEEAGKLSLPDSHLYHALLGQLYLLTDDCSAALHHFTTALATVKTPHDKKVIEGKIGKLMTKT